MSTDLRDRLAFGEGPLGGPLDDRDADADADAPPRRNRAFVYLAVAMAGLILLGILALMAAVTTWVPAQRQRQIAAATRMLFALTREAEAWTATHAPTSTPMPPTSTPTMAPTKTPVPTTTSTRVVTQEKQDSQQASKTLAPIQLPETTPAAGLGVGGMAAIAVGLTGLLFAARILRGQG